MTQLSTETRIHRLITTNTHRKKIYQGRDSANNWNCTKDNLDDIRRKPEREIRKEVKKEHVSNLLCSCALEEGVSIVV